MVVTASGLILPGRSPKHMGRATSALLLWRASDLDVVPVTEQETNFSRPGLSTPIDDKNVSWTASPHAPAWTMFASPGSLAMDRAALLMTATDALSWPILFMPPFAGEALTFLVEFNPLWPRSGIGDWVGIMTIGHGNDIADDKVTFGASRLQSGSLQVALHVGLVTTSVQFTIPSTGPLVLLAQLRPSGANHFVHAELNGVAQTNLSVVSVNGKEWRTDDVSVNKAPLDSPPISGESLYSRVVVARGQRTAEELMRL